MAILVNALAGRFRRRLESGASRICPPGVTVETLPMPANQAIVPVLFTATADAPLAGPLVDIVGRHADPNQNIEGHLRQPTSLVRGQNNIEVWNSYGRPAGHRRDASRAVHDRDRRAQGAAGARRLDGTEGRRDAQRRLQRADRGAACSTTRRASARPARSSIPEGQTEAVIPLTANGGAEVRKWKIVVLGEATVGDGPITVSSQLADSGGRRAVLGIPLPSGRRRARAGDRRVIKVDEDARISRAPAKVELLGLPNEVTTEPREITKDAERSWSSRSRPRPTRRPASTRRSSAGP